MPDQIARKRLKKKMVDRWENEGGMISPDPAIGLESSPVSENEGGGGQPSASQDSSTSSAPASRVKNRKPTRK